MQSEERERERVRRHGPLNYGRSAFLLRHCRELLTEILERRSVPADLTISCFFRARRHLGSHDRAFIADNVYDTLRAIPRYHAMLPDHFEGAPPADEASLVMALHVGESKLGVDREGAAEGLELDDEDFRYLVETAERFEERIDAMEEPRRSAVRHGLPEWLVASVLRERGEEAEELLEALNRQAPITLRANTLRASRERLEDALEAREISVRLGEHSPDALHLERRMNANSLGEFRSGWFELQDEGSQLLSRILDPHPNWKVFDACAGAGGKTLHIAALMKGRGEVVAHDTNERRLSEIRPRLKRSGAQNVRVMSHDDYFTHRKELAGTFDAVMIDAPCTGAGVLRRNPGARLTLDEAMLERIVEQQREILDEYAPLVRPGGIMLYATCSLLEAENEDQVKGFLARHPDWKIEPIDLDPSLLTDEKFFRSFPHRHGTDAFFGALLRRGKGEG